MSTRHGNYLRAVDVLVAASEANKQANGREHQQDERSAVKYDILKQRIGSDIISEPDESVSLEGNSGPYLQYAHARARSILNKAEGADRGIDGLDDAERNLARKIGEYPEVLQKSVNELLP